ncbi:MAG: hypothetical protein KHZ62_08415 [Clostridiales bacterium]|nr:hypothetical protein [Clostridiales bacterium]
MRRVRIHPSLYAAVLVFLPSGLLWPFFFAMAMAILHEMGHMCAARLLRVPIKMVTVTCCGVFCTMGDLGRLPFGARVLIFAAGPAVSLFLFLLSFFGGWDMGIWANGGILLLNILPTIPFDGGCIVFLFLARRSCLGAARLMGLWGQAAGGILAVLGIVQMILCPPNALLFLTGGVVFFEGRRLYGRAAVKLILAKRRSKGRTAKVYFYYLPDHASSWDQLRLLGTDTYVVFLRQKKGEIRWETEQEFLRRLFAEAG